MTMNSRLRLLGIEEVRNWTELKEEAEGALISLQIKKINWKHKQDLKLNRRMI